MTIFEEFHDFHKNTHLKLTAQPPPPHRSNLKQNRSRGVEFPYFLHLKYFTAIGDCHRHYVSKL